MWKRDIMHTCVTYKGYLKGLIKQNLKGPCRTSQEVSSSRAAKFSRTDPKHWCLCQRIFYFNLKNKSNKGIILCVGIVASLFLYINGVWVCSKIYKLVEFPRNILTYWRYYFLFNIHASSCLSHSFSLLLLLGQNITLVSSVFFNIIFWLKL